MIVDLPLAPLSVLVFLGTCLFVVAMFAMITYFQISGNHQRARLMLKFLGGGVALYAAAVVGASLFSKDYLLGRGAEKHFCEVDCHIAYSVVAVQDANSLPAEFNAGVQNGNAHYYIVTLRTRFDETTIGPQRGNGLLYPNPRTVYAIDESGKLYSAVATIGTNLAQPLRPGESYETQIAFALPADARNAKMLLSNSSWPNSLLIGHENSPLHRKVYFDLRS